MECAHHSMLIFSHVFLAFVVNISIHQSVFFGNELYKILLPPLCQLIAAWYHAGSSLQGVCALKKHKLHQLHPFLPVNHLFCVRDRILHCIVFTQCRPIYVLIDCGRIIFYDRSYISPPSVSRSAQIITILFDVSLAISHQHYILSICKAMLSRFSIDFCKRLFFSFYQFLCSRSLSFIFCPYQCRILLALIRAVHLCFILISEFLSAKRAKLIFHSHIHSASYDHPPGILCGRCPEPRTRTCTL